MEWMQAGSGAWHGGKFGDSDTLRGFQLWVALPPSNELGNAYITYISPEALASEGPVTVLLGQYEQAKAAIEAPAPINCLFVKLKAGETWRYELPAGHTVAWAAVSVGQLQAPETIDTDEMAAFEQGDKPIQFIASQHAEFVLGSACGEASAQPRAGLPLCPHQPRGSAQGRVHDPGDRPQPHCAGPTLSEIVAHPATTAPVRVVAGTFTASVLYGASSTR
jgi:redox-sensitive bicupin YhaK (pirin superfamily)